MIGSKYDSVMNRGSALSKKMMLELLFGADPIKHIKMTA